MIILIINRSKMYLLNKLAILKRIQLVLVLAILQMLTCSASEQLMKQQEVCVKNVFKEKSYIQYQSKLD